MTYEKFEKVGAIRFEIHYNGNTSEYRKFIVIPDGDNPVAVVMYCDKRTLDARDDWYVSQCEPSSFIQRFGRETMNKVLEAMGSSESQAIIGAKVDFMTRFYRMHNIATAVDISTVSKTFKDTLTVNLARYERLLLPLQRILDQYWSYSTVHVEVDIDPLVVMDGDREITRLQGFKYAQSHTTVSLTECVEALKKFCSLTHDVLQNTPTVDQIYALVDAWDAWIIQLGVFKFGAKFQS